VEAVGFTKICVAVWYFYQLQQLLQLNFISLLELPSNVYCLNDELSCSDLMAQRSWVIDEQLTEKMKGIGRDLISEIIRAFAWRN
jgi:hypothetical protein